MQRNLQYTSEWEIEIRNQISEESSAELKQFSSSSSQYLIPFISRKGEHDSKPFQFLFL